MKRFLRRNLVATVLTTAIFCFYSCDEELPENEEKQKQEEETPKISDNRIISENETWYFSEQPYVISGTLTVQNVELIIKPGTTLKFEKNAKLLIIGEKAKITAIGKPDSIIVFTSNTSAPAAGDWDCIEIMANSIESVFDYCTIEYAGSNNNTGAIYVNDGAIAVTNSIIRQSASRGVALNSNTEAYFTEFSANQIKETTLAPINIRLNYVHTIGKNNTIVSDHGIEIAGSDFELNTATWNAQQVPYVLNSNLNIRGTNNPTLILEGGTVIKMRSKVDIIIAGGSNYGTLQANGTEESPVIFTSDAANKQPGDWGSIRFDQGAIDCILDYCIIEYGGFNSSAGMVDVNRNALVSITNSEIKNAKNYELRVNRDGGNGFVDFSSNKIISVNGDAMYIRGVSVATLGSTNTFETPTNSGIRISGFTANAIQITSEITWAKQTVPYIIEDAVRVHDNGVLTILPGTELRFISGKHMEIGWDNTHGKLVAQGTEEEKIIFTSASPTAQKGDWQGIRFSRFALAGSIMEYCNIGYAGPNSTYKANIIVDPSGENNPIIKNCFIHNSQRHGVYMNKYQGAWGEPLMEDNTFSDNNSGDTGKDN
jgi:hypothetical protein